MRQTRARRRALLEIVTTRAVGTQQELVRALAERGFRVSQSTVSRDIAALGLALVRGRYVAPPAGPPEEDPHEARVRGGLLEVRAAGDHLLVLLTPPGEAPGVALALDALGLPGLVGTVAGDDTIFAAVESASARDRVAARLRRLARLRGKAR